MNDQRVKHGSARFRRLDTSLSLQLTLTNAPPLSEQMRANLRYLRYLPPSTLPWPITPQCPSLQNGKCICHARMHLLHAQHAHAHVHAHAYTAHPFCCPAQLLQRIAYAALFLNLCCFVSLLHVRWKPPACHCGQAFATTRLPNSTSHTRREDCWDRAYVGRGARALQ